jgi:hypothetical protein
MQQSRGKRVWRADDGALMLDEFTFDEWRMLILFRSTTLGTVESEGGELVRMLEELRKTDPRIQRVHDVVANLETQSAKLRELFASLEPWPTLELLDDMERGIAELVSMGLVGGAQRLS